jgi:hypothetical protein
MVGVFDKNNPIEAMHQIESALAKRLQNQLGPLMLANDALVVSESNPYYIISNLFLAFDLFSAANANIKQVDAVFHRFHERCNVALRFHPSHTKARR